LKTATIRQVSEVYQVGSECQTTVHTIADKSLKCFEDSLAGFRRSLRDNRDDPTSSELLRLMNGARFRFHAVPLPFCHPQLLRPDFMARVSRTVAEFLRGFPQHREHAEQLVSALSATLASEADPIADVIQQLGSEVPDYRCGLLLKEPAIVTIVAEAAVGWGMPDLEILMTSDLRSAECYDRIVVVGPMRWWYRQREGHIFDAPRAYEVHIVRYEWTSDKRLSARAFVLGSGVADVTGDSSREAYERQTSVAPGDVSDGDMELQPRTFWDRIGDSAELTQSDGRCVSEEYASARGFLLQGGVVVFLEAEATSSALLIEMGKEAGLGRAASRGAEVGQLTLERVSTLEVEPGDFLLLRTEGGGDLIPLLADRVMGARAAAAREKQRTWKRALCLAYVDLALGQLVFDLRQAGSGIASEPNILNWMRPDTIRPKNRADFDAIMRVLGLSDRADEFWQTAGFVGRAHQKAGQQIRRMLLERVKESSLGDLEREGTLQFELSDADGGSMTAFRVLEVALANRLVRRTELGRVMLPSDTETDE